MDVFAKHLKTFVILTKFLSIYIYVFFLIIHFSLCELMQWRKMGWGKGKILWGANGAGVWIKILRRFTPSWDSVAEGVRKHVKACEFAEYYFIVRDEERWSPFSLWLWWKKELGLQPLVSPWCSWYLEFAFICSSHSKLTNSHSIQFIHYFFLLTCYKT